MVKCISKEEATNIAKNWVDYHNKEFDDGWTYEVVTWAREVWVRNNYNDVVEFYQW